MLHTSERPGAGLAPAGAIVSLQLQGGGGHTQEIALLPPLRQHGAAEGGGGVSGPPFARGARAAFLLPPGKDCGDLALLRLSAAPGLGAEQVRP